MPYNPIVDGSLPIPFVATEERTPPVFFLQLCPERYSWEWKVTFALSKDSFPDLNLQLTGSCYSGENISNSSLTSSSSSWIWWYRDPGACYKSHLLLIKLVFFYFVALKLFIYLKIIIGLLTPPPIEPIFASEISPFSVVNSLVSLH